MLVVVAELAGESSQRVDSEGLEGTGPMPLDPSRQLARPRAWPPWLQVEFEDDPPELGLAPFGGRTSAPRAPSSCGEQARVPGSAAEKTLL